MNAISPPNFPKPLIFTTVCVFWAMEGDTIDEDVAVVNSPVDEISHLALDIGGIYYY